MELEENEESDLDGIQSIIEKGMKKVEEVLKKRYPNHSFNSYVTFHSVTFNSINEGSCSSCIKVGSGDYYSQYGLAASWVEKEKRNQ